MVPWCKCRRDIKCIPLIEKLEKNKKIRQNIVDFKYIKFFKNYFQFKIKKTIHQFFPIDSNYHSQKFSLKTSSIVFFIDSEIWPNMINNIKTRSI